MWEHLCGFIPTLRTPLSRHFAKPSYGHTHVPQVERFQHLWILNPGSPTERRSAPARSMLVLRVRGSRITPELVTL